MELAIIIIVVVAIAIYYGLMDSVETTARMANRRVERLEAEQIAEDIQFYNDNKIEEKDFEQAVEQKKQIKKYRDM